MATKIKIPSTAITGNSTDILTSPLNKLWRAKILLNRTLSTMPQNKGDVPKNSFPLSPPMNEDIQNSRREYYKAQSELRHKSEDTHLISLPEKTVSNKIIIINPNTSPYTKIIIQGMPSEIDVNPESNWATVKSVGRNNPFMMYTGGEDTISFDISWYSNQKDRKDVINKCRLLESWTRSDGYTAAPPVLLISWGNSNLFKDDSFILTSARYTLSNFQNSYLESGSRRKGGNVIDIGLLPNCAVQKLIFKRVTSVNRTHENIISKDNLLKTDGVIL